MKNIKDHFNYIVDPHTAIGIFAAQKDEGTNCVFVCLSTAHPGKFQDAVYNAIGKEIQFIPTQLLELESLPVRCTTISTKSKTQEERLERIRSLIDEQLQ